MFVEIEFLDTVFRAFVLASIALVWVVIVVRVAGLRAFSKMTAFDFVATVAVGSLLAGASQAKTWSGFCQASLAIAVLLGVQFAVALIRQKSALFAETIQNAPVMLMRDGLVLDKALTSTRVAREDLFAKLREANVMDLSEVRAVVLETTGDVSVLHGERLADVLLEGVELVE